MKAGGLVPDDLILRLIRHELTQRGWLLSSDPKSNVMTLCSSATTTADAPSCDDDAGVATFLSSSAAMNDPQPTSDPSASFLLDGFPRTAAQASNLDSIVPINLAVSINTPVDVIIERISGRWVHEPSGRVYNTGFNAPRVPGIDDVTGEPLVRRTDDDEEIYRQRFRKFSETSQPLLDHYANKGVLWEVEGLCSDEITPKLFAEFERRFC
jgi:adenylate kinase